MNPLDQRIMMTDVAQLEPRRVLMKESTAPAEGRSLLDLVTAVIRGRRGIVGTALLCGLAGAGLTLLIKPQYSSQAVITAQGSSNAGRLSGLASQFGINISGAQGGPSMPLYADLMKSDNLLRLVVEREYVIDRGDRPWKGTLVDLYGGDATDKGARRATAVAVVRRLSLPVVDDRSNVVTINVHTTSPQLSMQIASQVVATLNALNIEMRQRQAEAETSFMEAQLAIQAQALRAAEERLREFLGRNRQYQSDPQLTLERDRLARTVAMRQDVYTTLTQGYQQVRIDAARDTPMLSVVRQPLVPDVPDPVPIALIVVGSAVLGTLSAIAVICAREYLHLLRRERPEAYARIAAELHGLRDGLSWLLRPGTRRKVA